MDDTFVINIGRELGSGGREIGAKLAKKLNIGFYDRKLIDLASEESGLCKEFFEKADEKVSQNIISGLFGMRFPFVYDGGAPSISCLSNDALFKIQSDVIRKLAKEKSCLFVGRCADYILREHPRKVDIFITSPTKYRVERLCKRHNIPADEAESLIVREDKRRASYYNYYSYNTWGAAATYHLCIDSSIFGIDGTVEFLIEFIKKKIEI